MISAGHLAFQLGNLPDAAGLMTQAAEMSVELGERAAEGAAHLFLGLQQMFAGAPDKGRGHLTTARAVYQETGDLIGEGRSTAALGLSCFMDDERARARELLEAALAMDLAAEDRWSQGAANLYLGILAESSADPQAASSYFHEAVECQRPYDDSTLLPMALDGQASVMAQRDPVTALQVVAAAWAARARNGGEFAPYYRAFAERTRAGAAKRVGADADRLWRSGSRLTVDEAIALALAQLQRTLRGAQHGGRGPSTPSGSARVRSMSFGSSLRVCQTRRSRGGCTSRFVRLRVMSDTC
jgi:tetratricopeptide (TPR) repeat protein